LLVAHEWMEKRNKTAKLPPLEDGHAL
jgi:hypothetical protein